MKKKTHPFYFVLCILIAKKELVKYLTHSLHIVFSCGMFEHILMQQLSSTGFVYAHKLPKKDNEQGSYNRNLKSWGSRSISIKCLCHKKNHGLCGFSTFSKNTNISF